MHSSINDNTIHLLLTTKFTVQLLLSMQSYRAQTQTVAGEEWNGSEGSELLGVSMAVSGDGMLTSCVHIHIPQHLLTYLHQQVPAGRRLISAPNRFYNMGLYNHSHTSMSGKTWSPASNVFSLTSYDHTHTHAHAHTHTHCHEHVMDRKHKRRNLQSICQA